MNEQAPNERARAASGADLLAGMIVDAFLSSSEETMFGRVRWNALLDLVMTKS